MAIDASLLTPESAAERAVSVIGLGYDLSSDIHLSYCKSGPFNSRLIELDETLARDLVLPCGIVVPNVPNSIKCDKGERTRFRSDVLSFHQMSEQFNHDLSLTGKIPSGLFNAMFNFKGCWPKDATATKSLAFDGWFMTLYNIELARSPIVLNEHVKQEVPTSWDAAALAGFIEKYGTHVIVGVKMGGKDVIHIKQLENSNLQPMEVQKLLKESADERFSEDVNGNLYSGSNELSRKLKDKQFVAWELNTAFANSIRSTTVSHSKKEDIVSIHVRKGGINNGQSHNEWISTISQSPNVILMSFVPITSLLSGVRGSGFLSHAVNLYLRYKPPIEELHQFLEFQLPRQWAPIYSELPLGPRRKIRGSPALQFSFMGPKLYVNTVQVDSGNRPVTGIRLYLEGRKNDHLAIHLQHLEMLPKSIQLSDDYSHVPNEKQIDRGYIETVKCKLFSHVYAEPVQYNGACIDDEAASIVTKAWFEVKMVGVKKVLFLRLGFSMVASAKIRRSEWVGPSTPSRKSGAFSMLISTRFSTQLPPEKPSKVIVNSAVHPGGPPLPSRTPKLSHFLDTMEIVRGPEDLPGYWVVTGAKLCVEGGRISLKVKYSLLTIISDDDSY
ncbi:MACPF domain-containing protein NSL1 isoform X2 [Telopea speciosissima]|uniref:MACPF domain-containing protein NSL1 isoform X2 n=1 Tax=Telopea speciosissima TaxID=54955 RepID=UPI001CC59F41|nr:MACPF domain-containing protein NSL1 isoform X2 [Telopea speciosissima]